MWCGKEVKNEVLVCGLVVNGWYGLVVLWDKMIDRIVLSLLLKLEWVYGYRGY